MVAGASTPNGAAGGDDAGTGSGWITGIALLLPITLSVMAIVLLAPVLPAMLGEFSYVANADYLVPLVLTTPALCVALLSPLAGALGDRFGRRRLLIVALAAYGVVGLAPLMLTTLPSILLSRIGVGVAEAIIMVMSTTLIGDLYDGQRRDRLLAAQTAFASLSALLFFNVGGVLGTHGWRAPFWVYGSALVMLALVLGFTAEPAQQKPETQSAELPPFPWRRMSSVLGVTIFGSILFYTVQIHASTGLAAHGWSDPAKIGLFTSVASLGVPLGTFIYARLPHDRVAMLLMGEFTLLAIGFVLMGLAGAAPLFLIGGAISQVGAGLLLPTLLVWAMSQLHFDIRARGTGLWQAAFAFGQFFSPVVVTTLARLTGSLLPAFTALGIAAAIAASVAFVQRLNAGRRV